MTGLEFTRVALGFVALISVASSEPSGGRLAAQPVPAFPDAVGQGAASCGGRGGDVYHVTNLRDYDTRQDQPKITGSLRHAIRSAEGPRTIVFDVSGAIQLTGTLEIRKSNLTIAGQTSPGGITLCGYPVEISGPASDVTVRYLRIRVGDFHVRQKNGDLLADTTNGIDVGNGCNRVILDHLSVTWGVDETLSVTRSRNVTVQNSIIAESLNDSFHSKGEHGYGSLIRGDLTAADQAAGQGGYTFFGNLWAHHKARNPSIGGQQRLDRNQPEVDRRRTDVNLVNNVIYNWSSQPTHRSNLGAVRINFVANYSICGPEKRADVVFDEGNEAVTQLFHDANYADTNQDDRHDGRLVGGPPAFQRFDDRDELLDNASGGPFEFFDTVVAAVQPAETAYARVVAGAGASLWRDAIDTRILQDVVRRTGAVIDSQEVLRRDGLLPGIDDLAEVHRPADFDSDQDGLPDAFEKQQGLDSTDPTDGSDCTLSAAGFTNLEVYLHRLTIGDAG